ncbi:hypothetical protein ACT7C1_33005 [Bacillus paranthracis]
MEYELAIERVGEYQELSSKWRKTNSQQYRLGELKTWFTQKGIDVNHLAYSLQRMKWNVEKIEKRSASKRTDSGSTITTNPTSEKGIRRTSDSLCRRNVSRAERLVYESSFTESKRATSIGSNETVE